MGQSQATYLGGFEGFESTCCTVEVSTWGRGGACIERVLWISEDGSDCCGKDFALLRTPEDGEFPLPCVGWCKDGARLRGRDHVCEDTEEYARATTGLGTGTGTLRLRLTGEASGTLGLLLKQPME